MNARNTFSLATAALCLLLATGAAHANMLAFTVVTGTVEEVTTTAGSESITVGGTTYGVQPGSPAEASLSSVTVGEYVDLQVTMTGDPTVTGMVMYVAPHSSTSTSSP